MSETTIMNAIRLAVGSLPDVRLWRNNVGALLDSRGVPVHYGLAKGSGDLIGIVAPYGRFLSIEVKRPGGHTDKARRERQARWREVVTAFGGIAGQVESVDGAMALVVLARQPAVLNWDTVKIRIAGVDFPPIAEEETDI